MPKYVIERTVPGAGQMDAAALAAIAASPTRSSATSAPTSSGSTATSATTRSPASTWRPTRTSSASTAAAAGFPVDAVYEVRAVIDPTTCGAGADESGRDQPDHRPRGPREGDRRAPRRGRCRRKRPPLAHVPHQGGGTPGDPRVRHRRGVRRVSADPRADEALRGRRRRAISSARSASTPGSSTTPRSSPTPGSAGPSSSGSGSATAPPPSATDQQTPGIA